VDLSAARDFLDRRDHGSDQTGCLQDAELVNLRA
jgi:hypothetical protein